MNDRKVLNFMIEALNEKLANEPDGEITAPDIQEELDEYGIETRICDTCDKLMVEGYCIYEGEYHFCSDECMLKEFTPEEKEEALKFADTDEGDSYWTEWN